MRIPLFLLAFCLCIPPSLGRTAQNPPDDAEKVLELPTFSVLQKTERFELKAETQEFTVKYPPILPNSEQITEAGGKVLVRGVDYQIDFYLGKITLEERHSTTEPSTDRPYRLEITYRTLPFAIKQVYKRDLYGNPADGGQQDSSRATTDGSPQQTDVLADNRRLPTTDSQLEVSGSQTFGISVGSNRGVTQNQELRVNVEVKSPRISASSHCSLTKICRSNPKEQPKISKTLIRN